MCIVYFRHEAELNSELNWSGWILNSLIYPYSDEFISHVARKHTVWHLYFCDNNDLPGKLLVLRKHEDGIFLVFFPLVNIGQ